MLLLNRLFCCHGLYIFSFYIVDVLNLETNIKKELTRSNFPASCLSKTPFDRSSFNVSCVLFKTERTACRVFTEIAIPGC